MRQLLSAGVLTISISGCMSPILDRLDYANGQVTQANIQLAEANRSMAEANERLKSMEEAFSRFPFLRAPGGTVIDPNGAPQSSSPTVYYVVP